MKNFARFSSVAVIMLVAVTSAACSGTSTGAGPDGTAQPLLAACSGDYLCRNDKTATITPIELRRSGASCVAGSAVFESDQSVTTAGTHERLGAWAGDSLRFSVCADDGCILCTPAGAAPSSERPTPVTSAPDAAPKSCKGEMWCSKYPEPRTCQRLIGCDVIQTPVYGIRGIDHFEYDCQGEMPACSTYLSKESCESQLCEWK